MAPDIAFSRRGPQVWGWRDVNIMARIGSTEMKNKEIL
jgi:hypothetical protein